MSTTTFYNNQNLVGIGNVGIGRTDPSYGLDVYGATSAPGTIRALTASQGSGVAGSQLRLMEQTDSFGFAFQNINALRLGLLYYNGGSGTECVSVRRDNGNVGIGLTAPSSQLQVYGSGQATQTAFSTTGNLGGSIILQDSGSSAYNGGALVFGANQGYFAAIKGILRDGAANTRGDISIATRYQTGDTTLTNRMYITSTGYVGIGTQDPQTTLDVRGSAYFAGNVGIGLTSPACPLNIAGDLSIATRLGQFRIQGVTNPAYLLNIGLDTTVGAPYAYIQPEWAGNSYRNLALNPAGGNVGIGRTDPSYPLDVVGQPRFSVQPIINSTSYSVGAGAAAGWYRIGGFGPNGRGKIRIVTLANNLQEQIVVTACWSAAFSGGPSFRIEDLSSATFAGVYPLLAGQIRILTYVANNTDSYIEVYLGSVSPAYTFYVYLIEGDPTGATFYLTNPIVAGSVPSGYGAYPIPTNAFSVTPQGSSSPSILVTYTGNVGIGTPGPPDPLSVISSQATQRIANFNNQANSGGSNQTVFIHTDQSFNPSPTAYTGAALMCTTYPNGAAGNQGYTAYFGTSDGSAGSLSPQMVIKSNGGNVSLGGTAAAARLSVVVGGGATVGGPTWDANWFTVTTNDNNNQNAVGIGYNSTSNYGVLSCVQPSVAWRTMAYAAAAHDFYLNSIFAFSIRSNMTGGATTISVDASGFLQRGAVSDQRLKSNIVTMTDFGLKTITDLRPVSYEATPESVGRIGAGVQYGLIAQEVQNVFPYAVSADQDEQNTLTIDYNKLVPVLINSIKELSAKVSSLEQSLSSAVATQASLEAQLAAMDARLAALLESK